MKKLFKLSVVTLCFPLTLAACWNYKDINMRSIDLCIGVDNNGGEVQYVGEFAKLITNELEKGEASLTDVYKYKASGNFFESTRQNYDNRTNALDFSGAVRSVIFSQKYAEEIGIESYINRLNYVNQFRNSVLIAISDEPIETLLKDPVENDISVGYAIENTISYLSDSGRTLYKSAQSIVSDISFKNIGYLLPYISRSKGAINYLGFAVMKDSKMIGVIPKKESTGVLFLLSKKPTTTKLLSHPSYQDNLVNSKVFLDKRKIKTSYLDNHVVIDIDLKLLSEIMYEYKITPLSDNDIKILENSISTLIKDEITSAITKSKKDFKCDIFQIARHFKASNYTEYKELDWEKEYVNAKVNVNIKTTIKNINVLDPNGKVPTAHSNFKEEFYDSR